jgi:DNA-binding PucR family transcriptional regulator
LDELPAGQRTRLVETLQAWLDAQGEARPAADHLHVHVQTVRYRVGQLRDVLGGALDDPDGRLELALALRVTSSAP